MFKGKLQQVKPFNPAKITAAVQRSTREILLETAERVYDISQTLVPVDKGDLQDSGAVTVLNGGDTVEVSYGTDHAIAQEYGTATQAGTPFLRPAANQLSEETGRNLGEIVTRTEKYLK